MLYRFSFVPLYPDLKQVLVKAACDQGAGGDGFIARDISFVNTAGPSKGQAVALVVTADKSVFYRCSIIGYQDTLYTLSNRQFYRETDIYGTKT
ncbi:hypothetical protein IFM89_020488 [Coptis chinensis]|uniref:Pectinesterase catalytic domain-containing protein n=1 Tax=Coptis chinensis TaxID=261450 RepID=A0A835H7L7_9MAGN|nr:hypothetical protein IFM89_020488 [Coptis chinensis]